MEKQDIIDIIKAWEKLEQLDMVIASITGGEGIDQVEYKDLFGLVSVIKRHSRLDAIDDIMDILVDSELTPEEKAKKIV